jgi:hypothetical protein
MALTLFQNTATRDHGHGERKVIIPMIIDALAFYTSRRKTLFTGKNMSAWSQGVQIQCIQKCKGKKADLLYQLHGHQAGPGGRLRTIR